MYMQSLIHYTEYQGDSWKDYPDPDPNYSPDKVSYEELTFDQNIGKVL